MAVSHGRVGGKPCTNRELVLAAPAAHLEARKPLDAWHVAQVGTTSGVVAKVARIDVALYKPTIAICLG